MQKTAFLFPGQGSQTPGMGKIFLDTPYFQIANNAGEILGLDVNELLCSDNSEILSSTHNAQLAILITSLMAYKAIDKNEYEALCFAGHSLGQVSALICSETISLEDGLKFASARALETQKCADTKGGKMAALLGIEFEQALKLCESFEQVYLANDNAPGQIVIAGEEEMIYKAIENCKEFGAKKGVLLPVNGAFHTPFMQDATTALDSVLFNINFNDPNYPIISNDDAKCYGIGDIFKSKSSVHVSQPVLWRESMTTINNLQPEVAIEVGNGSTLAGLAKRCTPDLKVLHFNELSNIEKSK